ncbi:ABC transporter ATP-binding protein/permease [Enterococcus sp. HY326]|uniref:ABC transporter ATP-binding protein/permease n=1 Tax=Enterococcus sp. HY326 TaxID=2971265 RepID=UPI00223FE80D|nr:ABC transporter ATP-binding protein/permease [Enterococcus sp. HY326]
MIDKRLFQLTAKKPLLLLVCYKLINLLLSVLLWFLIAETIDSYIQKGTINPAVLLGGGLVVLFGKICLSQLTDHATYAASTNLRLQLREQVMAKAFRLGNSQAQISATRLSQYSVDGIEQLEIYYARFLPQLFYCLAASLVIFIVLAQFAWQPALILLICLSIIPIVIMAVMKLAKRILAGYWQNYTNLGVKFHENLQGLSVLKAFNRDRAKQQEMAADAEKFRRVTMSLLSMQLNSITIMDIVSYSGAALGIGLALIAYQGEQLTLVGVLMFILLSAEFFLPMRQLGSLFHVAMNGISACKNLFDYLERPEITYGSQQLTEELTSITAKNLSFGYQNQGSILKNLQVTFKKGQFTGIVGKSGSGKSTFVQLLTHQLVDYQGEILWNQQSLSNLSRAEINQRGKLVNNHGYLYPISLKENLLLAKPTATEAELWRVLEKVQLRNFVEQLPQQLAEVLTENGGNLSGGQRQRLLLARALLSEAELFIFDEITSGIDLASEKIILQVLTELAKDRIVIFISHRLYNIAHADQILVFEDGELAAQGSAEELAEKSAFYRDYFAEEKRQLEGVVIE